MFFKKMIFKRTVIVLLSVMFLFPVAAETYDIV